MPYDETLARRTRAILARHRDLAEKKMFGGTCFLLRGNMACGILQDDLIVRVGTENYQELLKLPHTRAFDITGRPMKGWLMVAPAGYQSEADLAAWVERGASFALTLPPK